MSSPQSQDGAMAVTDNDQLTTRGVPLRAQRPPCEARTNAGDVCMNRSQRSIEVTQCPWDVEINLCGRHLERLTYSFRVELARGGHVYVSDRYTWTAEKAVARAAVSRFVESTR